MSSDRQSVPVSLPPGLVDRLDGLVEDGRGRRRSDTALDSSFGRRTTNGRTAKRGRMSESGWTENVYLDLDVILAELKTDDWLASDVDIESVAGCG